MKNFEQWNGFDGRIWKEEINVRDFIQKNYGDLTSWITNQIEASINILKNA